MLDLVKKQIHMNRWKNKVSTQITLDDDFIVPDTMEDMEQMILDHGDIQIENSRNLGEKMQVKGKLEFRVLYRTPEGNMQTLAGSIPFEETINVPDMDEKDYSNVAWQLDDLNAGIINSRKLSVKAIITLDVKVESLYDAEAATDVQMADGTPPDVEVLKRQIETAAIALRNKDTFRIKQEIALSGNKPDMDRILWSDLRLRGVETRPLDGQIKIEGELVVFVIYESDGDNTAVQWLEESIPFSGEVEMMDAVEEMIPFITVRILHQEVEARPDSDGEMRELEIDAVLELDMKLYEEEEMELLSDLYSPNRELNMQTEEACFDRILAKNTAKCKLNETISLREAGRILQICHCDGTIKIDETEAKEDGLHIEGVLEVRMMYLTNEDANPIQSSVEMLPFHYVVEVPGINQDSVWQLNPSIEQLSAVMAGGDSVEIKAVLSLDILVLQPVCETVIKQVEENPLDMKKIQEMPGIVGYIVQPGDTLWLIAKKFHTTVDTIMATNGLTSDAIKPGDRLILVKEIEHAS